MTWTDRRLRGVVTAAAAALAAAALAGPASAARVDPDHLTAVPRANHKALGRPVPNKLSGELSEVVVAQGSHEVENPLGPVAFYGYLNDGNPLVAIPPAAAEAQKTEPDKNTYLVLGGQKGADPSYDYGTHFIFQGHEAGAPGSITRINLDADGDHRVTLLATADVNGKPLPTFDGSTWDPFAKRLLLTAELGANGGVWQSTLGVPAKVEDISGALGRGGYEGIQTDSDGNLWIVEDAGGTTGAGNARQPNSFLYRFVPKDRTDLTKGGRLQVLQATSLRNGRPIVFHPGQVDADITSQDTRDLHTYDHVFKTRWVTIHDTAKDGVAPYDANALAKRAGGTPFKRPENGVFRPGTKFRTFVFTETGDTNATTAAGSDLGGFGGVQVLRQRSPSADTGRLHLLFQGDPGHTGFDNLAFLTRRRLAVVEDRGDTLHTQLDALDSGWVLDARADFSRPDAPPPVRFLAEGRDPSATIDSALLDASTPGFPNDGDNEITGIHVSDGDPTPAGLLGAKDPRPFRGRGDKEDGREDRAWRVFWTQQHGDNVTWELVPRP
jgi:Bacterial protein of unknown function (DUF839)